MSDKVIAIACADLHFDDQVPTARAETQEEWMECQRGYLEQLFKLQNKYDNCPILCAGDVLNKWDCSPYLLNFLIQAMPHIYSIRGQHDTPYHSEDQMERSGFRTLVQAGKITPIEKGRQFDNGFVIHAFPWGSSFVPCSPPHSTDKRIQIALVHKYIWHSSAKHSKAKNEDNAVQFIKEFRSYDLVFTGDNHKQWDSHCNVSISGTTDSCRISRVFNCGSFMRRHSDEKEHQPRVLLIHESKIVKERLLDVSGDNFREEDNGITEKESPERYKEFVKSLSEMTDAKHNFEKACVDFLRQHKFSKKVKKMVMKLLKMKDK